MDFADAKKSTTTLSNGPEKHKEEDNEVYEPPEFDEEDEDSESDVSDVGYESYTSTDIQRLERENIRQRNALITLEAEHTDVLQERDVSEQQLERADRIAEKSQRAAKAAQQQLSATRVKLKKHKIDSKARLKTFFDVVMKNATPELNVLYMDAIKAPSTQ